MQATIGWTAYDQASESYFETYESLRFGTTHRAFLKFLPAPGSECLDIGSGSGRDAAALAKRGYAVTAVEPSAGLRKLASARHTHPHIDWLDDALPKLDKVKALEKRYDFILLSAVWMHIRPGDRLSSLKSIASVVKPGGVICMSLRIGPAPANRVMYPIDVNELLLQAKANGLDALYVSRLAPDALKRPGVGWIKVVLRPVPSG